MYEKTIRAVAVISTDYKEKFGIPRQSGRAPSALAKIVFLPEFRNPDALRRISEFSHLWLLFDFSLCRREEFFPTVRPPRLGGNEKTGVFASRAPYRPNGIGLSCVKLESVLHTENEGDALIVSGADLLDGTPIYDIKPYIPSADKINDASGGYSEEFTTHKLEVSICERLLSLIPEEKRNALIESLADDPRPSYKDDDNEYGMNFANLNVRFNVRDNLLTVTEITNLATSK